MLRTASKAVIGLVVMAASFWGTLILLDSEAPGSSAPHVAAVESKPVAPGWKGWNEALYLAVNPDVAAAIARKEFTSARQHYELAGFAEGRKGALIPGDWDEAQYLKANPDVAAAVAEHRFISGYHHYVVAGQTEKRAGGFPPNRSPDK